MKAARSHFAGRETNQVGRDAAPATRFGGRDLRDLGLVVTELEDPTPATVQSLAPAPSRSRPIHRPQRHRTTSSPGLAPMRGVESLDTSRRRSQRCRRSDGRKSLRRVGLAVAVKAGWRTASRSNSRTAGALRTFLPATARPSWPKNAGVSAWQSSLIQMRRPSYPWNPIHPLHDFPNQGPGPANTRNTIRPGRPVASQRRVSHGADGARQPNAPQVQFCDSSARRAARDFTDRARGGGDCLPVTTCLRYFIRLNSTELATAPNADCCAGGVTAFWKYSRAFGSRPLSRCQMPML